ncbi:MAG: hypothetical protein PWQ89_259 [Verrucomicrobiota bacterium]|nr:hypothetical protein [Verrucomicrobiota bacterium]
MLVAAKQSPPPQKDDGGQKCPDCGLFNPKNAMRCDCGRSLISSSNTPQFSSEPCNVRPRASNAQKLAQAGFVLSSNEQIIRQAGIKAELEAAVATMVQSIPRLGSTDADSKIIQSEGLGAALENSLLPFSKIDEDALALIRQAVLDNYLTNRFVSNGGIIGFLKKSFGMNHQQAMLVARDQSGKIHGIVTMLRAQKADSVGYQWSTAKDTRVRGNPRGACSDMPEAENHWKREGRFYLWASSENPPIAPDGHPFRHPPADGPPGLSTLCRCTAAPVFEIGGELVF